MSDDELGLLLDDAEPVLADVQEFVERCKAIDALRRPQGRRIGRKRLEACRALVPLVEDLRAAFLALAEPSWDSARAEVAVECERFKQLETDQ